MSECRNETSYSVTQWVREELEKNTDPDYREFHKSLVPGMGNFLGVRVPQLRRISKKAARRTTGALQKRQIQRSMRS